MQIQNITQEQCLQELLHIRDYINKYGADKIDWTDYNVNPYNLEAVEGVNNLKEVNQKELLDNIAIKLSNSPLIESVMAYKMNNINDSGDSSDGNSKENEHSVDEQVRQNAQLTHQIGSNNWAIVTPAAIDKIMLDGESVDNAILETTYVPNINGEAITLQNKYAENVRLQEENARRLNEQFEKGVTLTFATENNNLQIKPH